MSSLLYVKHPKSGTTYVYENFSYWDKELKQGRSHRKLIGKLDPATGELIPTGKRGPHGPRKATAPAQNTNLPPTNVPENNRIQELEETVLRLRKDNDKLTYQLKLARRSLGDALKEIQSSLDEINREPPVAMS